MPFFQNAHNFVIHNGSFNDIAGDYHLVDNTSFRTNTNSGNITSNNYTNSFNNSSQVRYNNPTNYIDEVQKVNTGENHGSIHQSTDPAPPPPRKRNDSYDPAAYNNFYPPPEAEPHRPFSTPHPSSSSPLQPQSQYQSQPQGRPRQDSVGGYSLQNPYPSYGSQLSLGGTDSHTGSMHNIDVRPMTPSDRADLEREMQALKDAGLYDYSHDRGYAAPSANVNNARFGGGGGRVGHIQRGAGGVGIGIGDVAEIGSVAEGVGELRIQDDGDNDSMYTDERPDLDLDPEFEEQGEEEEDESEEEGEKGKRMDDPNRPWKDLNTQTTGIAKKGKGKKGTVVMGSNPLNPQPKPKDKTTVRARADVNVNVSMGVQGG